ncbi:uncharacterized protein LAESUDRAFT_701145 [Laetiporus sulphureus 93-53]|uniref:CN hydrolase domain-containing protein n=1 Tax=Laetiporus sulphureus 93-53 TaxID=1314785 RepID=A0A165DXJ8_9APHY|nr:uncharacterized protein LAESUDRAFT_701145 [Laetiporus sulphureus 93-53]KZT05829.1 hypothetical protein LAESUDRAFT_701145 [Laetiporus sulphureus 93-53]
MSLEAFIVRHPSVYLGIAPVVALTALSITPPLFPLAVLLAVLRLHVQYFVPRQKVTTHGVAQVALLSLAGAVTHLKPSLHALSTPAMSIVVLTCLTAVTATISISAVALALRLTRSSPTPWSTITIFPAIWATVWASVAYISPVGRLVTWSPVLALGPYDWVRPIMGSWGLDWVVAAWAVVFSEMAGRWLVGSVGDDLDGVTVEDADEEVVVPGTFDNTAHNQRHDNFRSKAPQPRHALILALLLVSLAIPSYFVSSLPAPPDSPYTTPLGVACVLPDPKWSGERLHAPTLEDFILESTQLQSSTSVMLWPEGAVRFDTAADKDAAFKEIMKRMNDHKLVGVSFEQLLLPGSKHSNGTKNSGLRTNSFALLSKQGPVLEYDKRMLVPIAESFSLTSSSKPPGMYTLDLTAPKGWSKGHWAPNYTRPIPLTVSICLDFSSPSSFASLDSRPALILAPARTWHTSVGYAMWEQARARAEELGSMVLWCDGGEGGVSGVAGGGMREVMQVGQGSWSRRIGVQWPFDQGRTFFSIGGGYAALATVWGIAGVGSVIEISFMAMRKRARVHGFGVSRLSQVVGALGALIRRRKATIEEEPSLLD